DPKGRSGTGFAAQRHDTATHGFDETAANREAEPSACGLPVRAFQSVEFVEHSLKLVLGNADAAIADIDDEASPLDVRHNVDCRLVRAVFDGVVEKIEQDLFHEGGVEKDRLEISGEFLRDPAP